MKEATILHCMHADKFIDPFIAFIDKHFDSSRHLFLIRQFDKFPTRPRSNAILLKKNGISPKRILVYFKNLNRAEKVILHGLFHREIFIVLLLQPWLLKKCYWIMWGGDLYRFPHKNRRFLSKQFERVRAIVIKRIGHLVTYIKGDYDLARSWYGAKGQYHECLMYPSNLYKERPIRPKKNTARINILVGNSADPANNHLDAFERLLPFRNDKVFFYCPLSYGNRANANSIKTAGSELFGDRFIPLLDFMPLEEYADLLDQIDIAVFAHQRQQGMGITILLLGLGKKVFMSSDVTPWRLFMKLGVKVFDVNELDMTPINEKEATRNREIVASYFSERKLVEQYSEIFR